ncbi:MAG: VOC family protein [Alphaproteobacteria bacterium]|nr:VOC family protein [Alphaproteobacteria bacterium]
MKLKRVEHVAVAVHDMQASMKMLEETLGLELDYEERIGDTRLAMYPVGETSIELLQAEGPASQVNEWIEGNGQSIYHLCFEVDDIDAALAELKEKGVKLIDETPRTGHGGSRIAFLDPASTGNIVIELAELPPGH